MCGIAGILGASSKFPDLRIQLQRMQQSLKHRGPDDRGWYCAPDAEAGLVHTRLSILDLSEAGHQPMSSPDGRYWITFNGEIYNFRELRAQLEAAGHRFVSQTDTEVILQLYQREGANCVQHLRGMFAFAIWDQWEKTCFLVRDPLGIKPLYYWQSGSTLVFASELRTVLDSGLPGRSLDPLGLYGYLTSGSVPEPYTLIQGIQCLEAGCWLEWRSGTLTHSRYWQLKFDPQPLAVADAITQTRTLLLDSLQHHFVSDVPVGIFLSGGMDSTALALLSRQIQPGELRTYSIAFQEARWNEGPLARQMAERLGTTHQEYVLSARESQGLLEPFLQSLDQPTIDGFNTFCVSWLAHQDGAKVVLSGLGGDEVFGGYSSFQMVPRLMRLQKKVNLPQGFNASVGSLIERWSQNSRLQRIGNFLALGGTLEAAYRSYRSIFTHREALTILQQVLPGAPVNLPSLNRALSAPTLEDEVCQMEICSYLRNQLLRDSDVMSMNWGLELRVPFADATLIQQMLKIPSSIRLAAGKQLLAQAVPELPDWILNRPKQSFIFPFDAWMVGEWQDLFQTSYAQKGIRLQPWYRRWSLGILEFWLRQVQGA